MKARITLTILVLLILVSHLMYGQKDSLGREIYDSVKISLRDGILAQRYLPFDVPFYLYGDTTGIQSIQLTIIDGTYQAIQKDTIGQRSTNGGISGCNCSCKSLTEQRLEFFRNVRVVEGNPRLTKWGSLNRQLNFKLKNAHAAETVLSQVVDLLSLDPVEMLDQYHGLSQFRQILIAVADPIEFDNTMRLIDLSSEKVMALRTKLEGLKDSLPAMKNKGVPGYGVPKAGSSLYSWYQNSKTKFIEDQVLNTVKPITSQVLKWRFKATAKIEVLNDSIRLVKKDSAFYADFRKYHTRIKGQWQKYVDQMNSKICRDSTTLASQTSFDGKQCNAICVWNRNKVIGSGAFFFLPIPPLEPNTAYRFYFEVTRTLNSNEGRAAKQAVSRKIIDNLDKITARHVQDLTKAGFNGQDIRHDILYRNELFTLDILEPVISRFLKDEFGNNESPDIFNRVRPRLPVYDKSTLRKFLNALVNHELYGAAFDTTYAKNQFLYQQPELVFGFSHWNKGAFVAAGKNKEFQMVDTLNQIMRQDTLNSLSGLSFSYESIIRDVPSGLVPFSNLQRVNLRALDDVRDFDPKTVEPYKKNLQDYSKYLGHLQTFLSDELIADKTGLRMKLFAPATGKVGTDITKRSVMGVDKQVQDSILRLSNALRSHQWDVQRTLNMYGDFQDNLTELNTNCQKLIDSVLHNPTSVQLGTARNIGGVSSASFLTRAYWNVTADIGIAAIFFGKPSGTAVTPYFGANFNFRQINRQAAYGLFSKWGKSKELNFESPRNKKSHGWWTLKEKVRRGSSFVLGFTTSDFSSNGPYKNLIKNDVVALNLLTGLGLRITDGGRLGAGVIWTRRTNENPIISTSRIVAYPYASLSFDLDVGHALGGFGKLLGFK